jgi:hypothetical protein
MKVMGCVGADDEWMLCRRGRVGDNGTKRPCLIVKTAMFNCQNGHVRLSKRPCLIVKEQKQSTYHNIAIKIPHAFGSVDDIGQVALQQAARCAIAALDADAGLFNGDSQALGGAGR